MPIEKLSDLDIIDAYSYGEDRLHRDRDTNPFTSVTYSTYSTKYVLLFDKLSEWHFDFIGLIDAGLAIPATNEFNPYK